MDASSSPTTADIPNVAVLPPVLYGGAFLIVVLLQIVWPLRPAHSSIVLWIGIPILLASLSLGLWGRRTMHGAGTNISPLMPAVHLVASGPYRFTRNPLYIAMTLLYLGLTFLLNSWWGIILLLPVIMTLHIGVVRREERYLESKFGPEYLAYCSRVRRYF